jgi:hypothetical protein
MGMVVEVGLGSGVCVAVGVKVGNGVEGVGSIPVGDGVVIEDEWGSPVSADEPVGSAIGAGSVTGG